MKYENLLKGSDSDMEPTKNFNLLTDVRGDYCGQKGLL